MRHNVGGAAQRRYRSEPAAAQAAFAAAIEQRPACWTCEGAAWLGRPDAGAQVATQIRSHP